MKLTALLLLVALVAPGPAPAAPECSSSLTLPDSGQQLSLRWRQIGGDLSAFVEPSGLDAGGLKALRVKSLVAQGAQLKADVPLRVGDTLLSSGSRPLGFTLAQGGAPRFFVVDGEQAVDLPATGVEPGFSAPGLLLQWVWVENAHVRLYWHLGDRAGAVDFLIGAEPAPPRGG